MGEQAVVDAVVERFVNRVRGALKVHKIILYGSRARGDSLNESDYDMIIVSDDFRGLPFCERIVWMYRYFPVGEYGFEPLCYTREEFKRKSEQICIVREAIREGIEVFSAEREIQ